MRLIRYQNPSLEDGYEDPFDALQSEINRLFELPWGGEPTQSFYGGWTPSVDLYEDRDSFIVKAELPGMKKEDIDVSVHEGSLTISGERTFEEKDEAKTSRRERHFGRFQRTLSLSKPVDVNRASAAYKDGILTLTLPKAEEAKPKQIEIKAS